MIEKAPRPSSEISLFQLIPNLLTLSAICAGITAIRFGVEGNFVRAVQLILLACVIDGIDGRVARMLRSESKMGAELDSLADFLNFGVAAPLVLYFWALQDLHAAAWICVLLYSVCCVLRLARFNVTAKAQEPAEKATHFVGVPAPAGAFLALTPMFYSFASSENTVPHGLAIGGYLLVIGVLMISRIPTWSFKTVRVSRANVKYFLLAAAGVAAALLTVPWTALVALSVGYVIMVLWGLLAGARSKPA